MRSRSRHSRRTLPTQRSMCAFAFGASTGVRMTLIFSLWRRASKARGNFVSRSWIRNRTRRSRSSSSISRLRACCSIPIRVWAAGAGEGLDAAAADRDEDDYVEAAQPDGVDGEEVAGEDRLAVRSEEAAPRLRVAPRRRRQAGVGEDVTDGGRRDGDAELAELADDP